MYLVCDIYDKIEYGKIYNFKELYELLVSEIVEDIKANTNEHEIVKVCTEQLGKLAKNNLVNENYVIENLESYGWDIYNISDIKDKLNILKDFYGKNAMEDFNKVIEILSKNKGGDVSESPNN